MYILYARGISTRTPWAEKCELLWCQFVLAIFGRKHELKKIKYMISTLR
jgi:hypothetical protein